MSSKQYENSETFIHIEQLVNMNYPIINTMNFYNFLMNTVIMNN